MTTQSRGENVDRVFQEVTKHDANIVQYLYTESSYSHPNTVNFWRKIIYAWLVDHETIKFQVDDIQGMDMVAILSPIYSYGLFI